MTRDIAHLISEGFVERAERSRLGHRAKYRVLPRWDGKSPSQEDGKSPSDGTGDHRPLGTTEEPTSGERGNYSGHAAARPRPTPPRILETGPLRTVDQWEPNSGHRKHAEALGLDYDEVLNAFLDRFECSHGCTDLPSRSSLDATFIAFIDAMHRDGDPEALDDFPSPHAWSCPYEEEPW